jgi:hypothetical protein
MSSMRDLYLSWDVLDDITLGSAGLYGLCEVMDVLEYACKQI